ncbi:Lipopolysaccharide export system permease protein LptF [Halomicronema hongdechloris C2206]|uniref:Lipopolysaccharide export system permease protein LptF n=1 Tax=Halomicronema hongdechloris C2206 TaxID=1641165 RepID=A0A1Z3HQ90_9CYAN|nr:LptF/LptG family permease [Halomicronema hongdechloris]ASC72473.1 Lipopolysaccharide export system permease protein LptF [Halomicronema hongdechloris C2206]
MATSSPETISQSPSLKRRWFPTIPIMDRYISQELALPFLFGVGAFSSIGVSVGALFDLIRKVTEAGLSIYLALEILLLKLPEFIVLSFPMATLLATMMTYSRLSSDSELVALRACGVSVRRLVAPAIVLSLMITGLTFAFNELITPAANYRAAITLEQALNAERPPFQESDILYQEFQAGGSRHLNRLFYARQFDGERMQGLTILDFSQDGLDQIVSAESASWNVGNNTWDFFNGTIYAVSPDGSFSHIVKFDHQELQLPRTPLDLASRTKADDEMNIAEARRQLEMIRQSGDAREIRVWQVRIQQKYALPFVCLVFGLVGASIGVLPQRTSRATSFGISVVIIFGYYLFAFIANAMGEVGVLSPWMSAWLPVLLGIAVGSLLLARASR